MNTIVALVLTLVLVSVLAGCQPPVAPTAVQPAPDFTMTTLGGDRIQLAALRGRWVLVNFWATWCAPCREEMPYLDRLAAQRRDQLTVLAVNMREPEQEIAAFVDELDLDLPVLLAPDDATLLAYNVRGLPLSILIDPGGSVVRRIAGPMTPGLVEAEIENER